MTHMIIVGDIVTDILAVHSGPLSVRSDTEAEIHLMAGGSAANTAAWLTRAGYPVTLVGVVGDDESGQARLAELTGVGVDCAVRQVPAVATGSVVVLSHGEERTMLCDRGANRLLSTVDIDTGLESAPDAVHLHLSGYALFDDHSRPAARHALAAATARGLTTSVDAASAGPLRRVGGPSFLDWAAGADLLLANEEEAMALLGTRADPVALAERLTGHAPNVVVKLGAAGSIWAAQQEATVCVPAEVATVVDTTGAGDAFAAGLLASWLGGAKPADALHAGAVLGAAAVGTLGARPS